MTDVNWEQQYRAELREHQEFRTRSALMLNNLVERLDAAERKARALEHELQHARVAREEALATYDRLRQRAEEAESWCSLERAAKEEAESRYNKLVLKLEGL